MTYEILQHPLIGRNIDPFEQKEVLQRIMNSMEKSGFNPIDIFLLDNEREERKEIVIFFHKPEKRKLGERIKEVFRKQK
jgi:hypothetical protein